MRDAIRSANGTIKVVRSSGEKTMIRLTAGGVWYDGVLLENDRTTVPGALDRTGWIVYALWPAPLFAVAILGTILAR